MKLHLPITPFSQFSLRRGLPAVIIGFIRQYFAIKTLGKSPEGMLIQDKIEEITKFLDSIKDKIELVDSESLQYFQEEVSKLINRLIEDNFDQWEDTKKAKGLMVRMSQENSNDKDVLAIINSTGIS